MVAQARPAIGRLIGAVVIVAIVILAGIVASTYYGLSRTGTATSTNTTPTGTLRNGNCSAGAAYADEWLTFKHDPQRTGYSSFGFSSSAGKFLGQLAWQTKSSFGGEILSAQNEIFGAEYELDALSSSNGALLWSVQTGAGPAPPLSSDGRLVYLGSNLGGLYAFNATTGKNAPLGNVMTLGAAAICGDVAYVSSVPGDEFGINPSVTGSLLAMNLSTGKTLWNVNLANGSFIGYPTTDGEVVYSVISNDTVVAFAANSGALVWKDVLPQAAQTGTQTSNVTISSTSSSNATNTITLTANGGADIVETPPLAGGELFVTTTAGHVYALNATDGGKVWSTSLNATIEDPRSSSAVGYGKVFLGTSEGLFAISSNNGSVVWKAKLAAQYPLADQNPGTPTVVDGSVFVADRSGTLYQFDANNGTLLWHFSGLGGGYVGEPIVADGLIVIAVNNGVFAFR